MTDDGIDFIGCFLLTLVIIVFTLGAIGTAIQVSPWWLLAFVPLDLAAILLLVVTVAVGLEEEQ